MKHTGACAGNAVSSPLHLITQNSQQSVNNQLVIVNLNIIDLCDDSMKRRM